MRDTRDHLLITVETQSDGKLAAGLFFDLRLF
jgi:hypothetical protein